MKDFSEMQAQSPCLFHSPHKKKEDKKFDLLVLFSLNPDDPTDIKATIRKPRRCAACAGTYPLAAKARASVAVKLREIHLARAAVCFVVVLMVFLSRPEDGAGVDDLCDDAAVSKAGLGSQLSDAVRGCYLLL